MNEKLEIGTKITGNWGAMYPTSNGVIVSVETGAVEIQWDDNDLNELDYVHDNNIHEKGWRSANGSGIGIFLK